MICYAYAPVVLYHILLTYGTLLRFKYFTEYAVISYMFHSEQHTYCHKNFKIARLNIEF
jgi:hypothetical protein